MDPEDNELRFSAGESVAGVGVVREVGRGGMAIVYEARDAEGRRVALKVSTAECSARTQTQQRFANEARLGAAVDHPSVVKPFDFGQLEEPRGFEGRMYLVTEFVDGHSLRDELMRHSDGMPASVAVGVGAQLAQSIAALHGHGIVHRDLNPSNLLVDKKGMLRVIDFGLAYALGGGEGVSRSPDLTMEGVVVGTPLYMSPQQVLHMPVTEAFDVYSFGIVMYELLCGKPPHAGLPENEIVVVRSKPTTKIMSLRKVAREAPQALTDIVERCLAYEPGERPSAAQLVEFFDGFSSEVKNEATEASPNECERGGADGPESEPEPEPGAVLCLPDEVSADSDVVAPRGDEDSRGGLWRRLVVLAVLLLVIGAGWRLFSVGPASPAVSEVSPLMASVGVREQPEMDPEVLPGGASMEDVAPGNLDVGGRETATGNERGTDGVGGAGSSDPSPKRKRGPRRNPKVKPEPESGGENPAKTCAEQRARAVDAGEKKEWSELLSSTRAARCWDDDERSLLRAKALFHLHRYERCAKEAAKGKTSEHNRLLEQCYLAKEGQ